LNPKKRFTVPVVDDEPEIRSVAREMLESGGYQVCEASRSDEAVAQLQNIPTDLALTDFVMSETGNIEPMKRLLERYGAEDCPYVRSIAEPRSCGSCVSIRSARRWDA
jgi:CheY-like chemotaxis protein